jgi:hypothetical protein
VGACSRSRIVRCVAGGLRRGQLNDEIRYARALDSWLRRALMQRVGRRWTARGMFLSADSSVEEKGLALMHPHVRAGKVQWRLHDLKS